MWIPEIETTTEGILRATTTKGLDDNARRTHVLNHSSKEVTRKSESDEEEACSK